MSKFLLYCSCIICKKQTTTQSLTHHHNTHFKILETKPCINCSVPHTKIGKFCGHSCSATFNNTHRTTLFKTGPKKGFISEYSKLKYPKYSKISFCTICNTLMKNKTSKTCSAPCKSKLLSTLTKGKTGGNTNRNLPGIDSFGKPFYYDSNWEITLAKSLTDSNIKWSRPSRFILSDGRSYTPDFFLPDYNVYLDPKAHRKNYYGMSVDKIKMFRKEYNIKCLIITNKNYLSWDHVKTMLIVNSDWS